MCPPGTFQNMDICVRPDHSLDDLPDKFFQTACERMEWTEPGHQLMAKDIMLLNDIVIFHTRLWGP